MWWTRRRSAWTAGAAGLFTGVGLVVAVPPAIADIAVDVPYVCATSSATHQVRLRLAASVPTRGTVGKPIRIGAVRMSLTVPAAMVTDLSAPGERESPSENQIPGEEAGTPLRDVSGSARLAVTALQNGQAMAVGWPEFSLAGPKTSGGPVTLTGTGRVTPLTPGASGDLRWVGEALSLTLAPAYRGAPADPVRCASAGMALLGTVGVRGTAAPRPSRVRRAGPTSAAAPTPTDWACTEIPARGLDPAYDFNDDGRLQEVFDQKKNPPPNIPLDPIKPGSRGGNPYCIRVAGFTNVKKLGSATSVAAQTRLRRTAMAINPPVSQSANYTQQQGYFVTDAMPSTATLLGFGFIPTKATATVEQVVPPAPYKGNLRTGNLRSDLSVRGDLPQPEDRSDETRASAFVKVHAGDTWVNGMRVPLGENCATVPTQLNIYTFTGKPPAQRTDLTQGSTITASANLPPFTGCGVGEDLDPLLTASISGTGNSVRLEAAPWCLYTPSAACASAPNEPITLTVDPGGPVVATAPGLVIKGTDAEIRCDSMTMKLNLPTGHWLGRFPFADVSQVSFGSCTYKSATRQAPVTIKADPGWLLSILGKDDKGVLQYSIQGITFGAEGDFGTGKCVLRFGRNVSVNGKPTETPATFNARFSNELSTLSFVGNLTNPLPLVNVTFGTKAECQKIPGFAVGTPSTVDTGTGFPFTPPQSIRAS